jgi:hypothetical protein
MTTTTDRLSAGKLPATTSFPDFFAAAKQHPVYVVLGVQGSGTNLLRSILVSAFNFSVVQDQSLVFEAAVEAGPSPSQTMVRRQFEMLRERALPSTITRKTRRHLKANGSFEGIERHFDAANITSGTELAYFIYAYSAFSLKSTLMAIKSDDLWESIQHIDEVLPNRRIILLTRDFRDNLLSVTKKHFGPIDPLVSAQYVKRRFAFYEAEYRRTAPERRFHVRYEDLLEAPDAFVAAFSRHFHLSDGREAAPPVDKARIRSNNRRKWASLSPRELALCEAVLRDELQTYGYGTECEPVDPPGATTRLMANARDAAQRVPQKIQDFAARLRK